MELALTSPLPLPAPRVDITIRRGTIDDIPFMDALQKKTTRQVGWMPTKQFEGKVAAGHVLVGCVSDAPPGGGASETHPTRVAYLIGNDQYFKRDDVGIIYQINVVEEYRRSFVGAALLKAQFERSAYGCKLYCCWCAQDIAANRFWESMGFTAIAFRTGSATRGRKRDEETKRRAEAQPPLRDEVHGSSSHSVSSSLRLSVSSPRIHIFWQKRIRAGDAATPFWFPSKTDGGALGAQRLVLPIPPGMRWSDELPVLLPGEVVSGQLLVASEEKTDRRAKRRKKTPPPPPVKPMQAVKATVYGPPGAALPDVVEPRPAPALPGELVRGSETPAEKPKRAKAKASPAMIAKARELRDRWSEQQERFVALPAGKYDVAREVEASGTLEIGPKMLAA